MRIGQVEIVSLIPTVDFITAAIWKMACNAFILWRTVLVTFRNEAAGFAFSI
jgi:hypothetical protein